MPAVIGEGLKPLTTSQTPSENSHKATGMVAIPAGRDICPQRPNRTAISEAKSRGAPISPTSGMIRGTRPDRYIREPSSRALITAMKPGPNRNVQSYMATSAWPVTSASAPAPACRKVTTDSRLTTPLTMMAASRTREPTKPNATPSFCRLTTGYRATAVPKQARANITSRKPAKSTCASAPGPTM